MKKSLLLAVAFLSLLSVVFSSREAPAAPLFARQTGMACNACHFQHFPTLNAFGRAFKSGGYTQTGGQSLVEGDFLSLPSSLNASLITKLRFQKQNGDSQTDELNKGQLQFPDEAALLIGGRGGEHVGFLLELSLADADTGNRFTNFKMPVVFEAAGTKLNAILFSTSNLGPAYGFELLATGALRNSRPLEHRKDMSAQQYIGTDKAATGIAFVASNPMGFANYSIWSPVHGTNATGPYLNYARLAATPTIAGWDLGVGGQWWTGTSKRGPGDSPTREHADAWAIDAQAQGIAGDYPLGVYTSYALAKKSYRNEANMFNTSTNKSKSAWAIAAELGVIPNKVALAAAYRVGRNGDPNGKGMETDNATTLGVTYNPMQNMYLQLNHSWYTGDAKPTPATGNMLTSLVLFAAF